MTVPVDARGAAAPLPDGVRLDGGFWGSWQQQNRQVTIPHGIGELLRAGYLDNFRRVLGEEASPHPGPHYVDSDLYKVLEAIGWDGGEGPPGTEAFVEEAVDLITRAQDRDGYLNTWYQFAEPGKRWQDLAFGHEMYTGGHLVQAAIALARGRGDDRLIPVAEGFADLLWSGFGPGSGAVDGHPGIEMALVELYRHTGREQHLELAASMVQRRGHSSLGPGHFGLYYCSDDVPVRQADHLRGHAVRALYLATGATDVAIETGDRELLDVVVSQWEDLVSRRSYLTGGVGSRHFHEAIGDDYELPPDRAYAESCASVAMVMWSWRLLLATGEARFAEHAERVLHNGFAASTALSRDRFWYQNPLWKRHPGTVPPEGDPVEERIDLGVRAPWYRTACCPPNIMRTIGALHHQVATVRTTPDGQLLALEQLAAGEIDLADGSGRLALRVETDYPSDGTVTIEVIDTPARDWTLALRQTSWSPTPVLRRDGQPVPTHCDALGYLRVPALRTGERIDLDLDLQPRITVPDERIHAVRGCVAVERGPQVYAAEGIDLPPGVGPEDLALDPTADLAADYEPDLLGGQLVLAAHGSYAETVPAPAWPYGPGQPPRARRPLSLRLIPYAIWANRGPSTVRVWLPIHSDATP